MPDGIGLYIGPGSVSAQKERTIDYVRNNPPSRVIAQTGSDLLVDEAPSEAAAAVMLPLKLKAKFSMELKILPNIAKAAIHIMCLVKS